MEITDINSSQKYVTNSNQIHRQTYTFSSIYIAFICSRLCGRFRYNINK